MICDILLFYRYSFNFQQCCKPILWTSQVNIQSPHLTQTGRTTIALDVIAAATYAQRK